MLHRLTHAGSADCLVACANAVALDARASAAGFLAAAVVNRAAYDLFDVAELWFLVLRGRTVLAPLAP